MPERKYTATEADFLFLWEISDKFHLKLIVKKKNKSNIRQSSELIHQSRALASIFNIFLKVLGISPGGPMASPDSALPVQGEQVGSW